MRIRQTYLEKRISNSEGELAKWSKMTKEELDNMELNNKRQYMID